VIAYTREDGWFVWEAKKVENATLMTDLLATARNEYPATGLWLEPGVYVPDLLGEAVQRVVQEFGGEQVLLQANAPAPRGTIF
jgi:hypothetical protein